MGVVEAPVVAGVFPQVLPKKMRQCFRPEESIKKRAKVVIKQLERDHQL